MKNFTVDQIKQAHSKVKSGADFSAYVQDLIKLGVLWYETFVLDGHTKYYGKDGYNTESLAKYGPLSITPAYNHDEFVADLKDHQHGGSDYLTFCGLAAKHGIEKWVVDMGAMTCTYKDCAGEKVYVEAIPL